MNPFGDYEPEPVRNTLAEAVNLVLILVVLLVMILTLFGRLDPLLEVVDRLGS